MTDQPFRPMTPLEFSKRRKVIFATAKSYHDYEARIAELEKTYRRPDPSTVKAPPDPRAGEAGCTLLHLAFSVPSKRKLRGSTSDDILKSLLARVAKTMRLNYDGLIAMARDPDKRFERRLTKALDVAGWPFASTLTANNFRQQVTYCSPDDIAAAILRFDNPVREPPPETYTPTEMELRIQRQVIERMTDLSKKFQEKRISGQART
jgi:hypothetical protein